MHALLLLLLACPPGNLAQGKPVTANAPLRGVPATVTDGYLPLEGTFWESPTSVVLPGPQTTLSVDLGETQEIHALALQADDNDAYPLEGSIDGVDWSPIWTAPPKEVGHGLRTRVTTLGKPAYARYLRLRGTGGDGFYSISELRAYCQVPVPWPPVLAQAAAPSRPSPNPWWNPMEWLRWAAPIGNDGMVGIKGTLAGAGALLLFWGYWLRRRAEGSGKPAPYGRLRDRLLAACGILSLFCWWNLGHYHFENFRHLWEHYHYYVGAKYFRELGYTRLYECTAAAEMEMGYREVVAHRPIRNLETNHMEPTDRIVADPTLCTSHFTPARWQAFKHDIDWFRRQFSQETWNNSQHDHGYNGTPVWNILGSALANLAPVSNTQVWLLALLDPLLLLTMWGFVLWAFGWRATCVALLFWGTNYPARYWWNGGAYLRMDWLASAVIGICLLKRGRMAAGGFAMTYAALLRIFPGFIVIGLVLKGIMTMWRQRKLVLTSEHKRFARGAISALAVLVPLSCIVAGGASAWPRFVDNSRKHLSTALTNNMGLKTVVAYQPSTRAQLTRNNSLEDPFESWKNIRLATFAHRKPLFILLVLAFCVLLAHAVEHEEQWVAACLGVGMIPIATELTCYYYSILLAFGLLWLRREKLGFLICAYSVVTSLLTIAVPVRWLNAVGLFSGWYDDNFTWMSAATVIFLCAMTASFLPRMIAREEAGVAEPQPPQPAAKPAQATAGAQGQGRPRRQGRKR